MKTKMSASFEDAFYYGELSQLESILIKYGFYNPLITINLQSIPF